MSPSEQAWRRRLLGLAAVVLIVGTTSVPRSLVAGQAAPSHPPGPDLSAQAADADPEWMKALALARCTLVPRY
jgi:hypothetical protein